MPQQREVVLVNMPFSNLRWPHLGLSLLEAGVKTRGFPCRILYLNYDFAEQIGYDTYQWIADRFAFTLGGERLFAKAYFGELPTSDRAYFDEVLRVADPDFSPEDEAEFARLYPEVERFLDRAFAAYPWEQAILVGFSTTFQQTVPALALAKRIKAVCPHITIVFGGAACEDEMGPTLAEQCPEVDFVFPGEADESFPQFVEWLLKKEEERPLPAGVISRQQLLGRAARDAANRLVTLSPEGRSLGDHCGVGISGGVPLVENLDCLPVPDFDDFFTRYFASPLRGHFEPVLFFEMSRGCWWGQKHHCAFCGLNGQSMRFRSKSPKKILAELRFLIERYRTTRGCAADNILDFRFFRTLLPALESAQLPFRFACELKVNLTRSQVAQLLRAGLGAAQLGIETFDSELLRRIDKGARGYQNLQTLKWFTESGIEVEWNWLYGFPGETTETYRRLIELIPLITHLVPPLGTGRVRMDRFSPFFEEPGRFGMVRPRASRAFRHVYPFPQEVLDRLAYYYEFDFADGYDPTENARKLLGAIARWSEDHGVSRLIMRRAEDGSLLVLDTRPVGGFRQHRLRGWEAELYEFCDEARNDQALQAWREAHPEVDGLTMQATLRRWCQDGMMLFWDERYLALACRAPEQSELHAAARAAEQRTAKPLGLPAFVAGR